MADRVLGLLAQTIDKLNQATGHFEDALAFCRKASYRPELAWTCCDYADALLVGAHGRAPLRLDQAIALLEEALAISTELGMRPLMERVTERLDRVRSGLERAPTFPDGLTQREVEVLRLIAAGKSNREIAEELVITLNTVFRHVANIYDKIGAANRVEATVFANEHGLLDSR